MGKTVEPGNLLKHAPNWPVCVTCKKQVLAGITYNGWARHLDCLRQDLPKVYINLGRWVMANPPPGEEAWPGANPPLSSPPTP